MDSEKKAYILPIILALIPPVATILSTFITATAQDKPIVTLEKSAVGFFSATGSITLSNIGGGTPATNVTVFVDANSKILTAQQSNFILVTLPKNKNSIMTRNVLYTVNDTSFQFKVPKLIHGDAGIINVKFQFEEPDLFESFDAVAFYDQGSSKARFAVTYISPEEYTFIASVIAGLLIFFIYMYFIFRRKYFTKIFVDNLLNIRRHLLDDIRTRRSFTDGWKLHIPQSKLKPGEDGLLLSIRSIPKFIKNLTDRIRLDDVLQLISARERTLDSIEINSLNLEILSSIDKIFEEIDWSKYR